MWKKTWRHKECMREVVDNSRNRRIWRSLVEAWRRRNWIGNWNWMQLCMYTCTLYMYFVHIHAYIYMHTDIHYISASQPVCRGTQVCRESGRGVPRQNVGNQSFNEKFQWNFHSHWKLLIFYIRLQHTSTTPTIRGHPFITSTKKSGFWHPLPCPHASTWAGPPPPLVDVHTRSTWNTHRSLEMASTMKYRT